MCQQAGLRLHVEETKIECDAAVAELDATRASLEAVMQQLSINTPEELPTVLNKLQKLEQQQSFIVRPSAPNDFNSCVHATRQSQPCILGK